MSVLAGWFKKAVYASVDMPPVLQCLLEAVDA
jgi:hypothetical protein